MMLSPNLLLAQNRTSDRIEIGYDIAAGYYTLTQNTEIIKDGVHIEASKKLVLTIAQIHKLTDDLNRFVGAHGKYAKADES